METSQTIGKLAAALAKAQGEIEAAKKDSTNPHFRSKYADLASVRDAIQAALSKHGIAYIQFPEGGPDTVTITTVLACGDEWMRASYEMRPVKADPQGMGSAITYARRYALAAAVGVAPEDDDGNEASGKRPETNGKTVVKPTLAPSPADKKATEIEAAFRAAKTVAKLDKLAADNQAHIHAMDEAKQARLRGVYSECKSILSPEKEAA